MKSSKFFIVLLLALIALPTYAQSVDELKSIISNRNEDIKKLEEEIKGYQAQIASLGNEADSLKKTLAQLDLSRKKIETDLAITLAKIDNTNLEIKELSLQIEDKSERIIDGRRVIAQSLTSIAQTDNSSLLETILSSQSLAAAWDGAEKLTSLQSSVRDRILDLQTTKVSLETNKQKTEQKKTQLVSLQKDLANQKKVLADTVKEKNNVLAATKNTEANYKKLLATREAQKKAFEKELLEYETALKNAIDPSSIPSSGSGVLAWPLAKVVITQYFGNTTFATKNASFYNGQGHNGIDFGASVGTQVKAAAEGTVLGTGNTDLACPYSSYGKWVLIQHGNGLTTLYAHLSLITVEAGQKVARGEAIGYSGNTGLSTGPHLHFGVYASDGVAIGNYKFRSCQGKTINMPVLTKQGAYLNPLSYL